MRMDVDVEKEDKHEIYLVVADKAWSGLEW